MRTDLSFNESELRVLDRALWLYIKDFKFDRFNISLSEIDDFKKHLDLAIDLRLSIRSCFDKELMNRLTDIDNEDK